LTSVTLDKRVEKAIARLRAMGFKVNVYAEDEDTGYIFITLESIAKFIERRIGYPHKRLYVVDTSGKEVDGYLVVKVWREWTRR